MHPREIEIVTRRGIRHHYRPSVDGGNSPRSLGYEVTNLGQGNVERSGQAPGLFSPTEHWHGVELVGTVFSVTQWPWLMSVLLCVAPGLFSPATR